MRIACPSCHAAYEVPLTLMKPGRAVRCARCAHEWVPPLALPDPLPMRTGEPLPRLARESLPADAAAETDEVGARPARHGRGFGVAVAWLVSLIALALLIWGAYAERSAVMQLWPASAQVYSALGLTDGR
jgi:predicted Zn finger-like uncharacterized protein